MKTVNVIDEKIETYRSELTAEAEIAKGDLDEIEDHLRILTEELRATGLPAATAVEEAARRLGDPREIAREHARVTSPFGARLPKLRAWSAAALLAPFATMWLYYALTRGSVVTRFGFESVLGFAMVGALALRLSWARAFVLGVLAMSIVTMIPFTLVMQPTPVMLAQFVAYVGAFAFVVPWRRGELSRAGIGLALMGPAYGAALAAMGVSATLGPIAFFAVVIGSLGGMLRARWGAIATSIAAPVLGLATLAIYPFAWTPLTVIAMLALTIVGAGCAAIAAVLAWKSARSTLGTLRGLTA